MKRVPAILVLAALALPGCAPAPINQEQMSQADLQADVNSLKSTTQAMRMRLDELEGRQGKQGQGVTLEDVNRRLTQLEETVARMAATLGVDSGVRAPSPSAGQAPAPAQPGTDYGSGYGYESAPGTQPYYQEQDQQAPYAGPPATAQDTTDPAQAIFGMGMDAYNQRDFDRANTLFAELIKSYPTSRQAPDALFWQADVNFQQGDYARAALICQDLIQKYPNHPRVASAMLKQGQCFSRLGKTQAARIVFEDLVKRFPNSAEARIAQNELRGRR